MPIVEKMEKPSSEEVLRLLPDRAYWEIAIGNSTYKLFSLPAKDYIRLVQVVRPIIQDVQLGKANEKVQAVQAAKELSKAFTSAAPGGISEDTTAQITELINLLSRSAEVDPSEIFMDQAFIDKIAEILDIVLEGVDPADKEAVTSLQLANILEAVIVLNFNSFARVINNTRYLFRSPQ